MVWIGDVQGNGKEARGGCVLAAFECRESGGVARGCNHIVALSQDSLDVVVAEACGCSSDQEDFGLCGHGW